MAHITSEQVKNKRNTIKKKYKNFKFSVTKEHCSKINCHIMSGDQDFSYLLDNSGTYQVNPYYFKEKNEIKPEHKKMFSEIIEILKGKEYFDKSDIMTDYFHVSHYFHLEIGKWDKPYKYIAK